MGIAESFCRHWRILLFTLILAAVYACRNSAGPAFGTSPPAKDDHSLIGAQQWRMPGDSLDPAYQGVSVRPVRAFYMRRDEKPFWISDFAPSPAADSLIDFIEGARYYGLNPGDYHLDEIGDLRHKLTSPEDVYRLEALLTDAYIVMFRQIRSGRESQVVTVDSAAISSLDQYSRDRGLTHHLTLAEPSFQEYRLLRQGLARMIDSLTPEEREAVLQNSPMVPDSVRMRIGAIEANLERWRRERQSFGNRYILVNIPAFVLYVVENDSVVLQSKIIVGKPETPTPELSGVIECFITYPYWHVPRKIAVGEYLPAIQRNIEFLERNNFDVLDRDGKVVDPHTLDWKKFNKNYFPVSLRQREGEENALGVIKFVFDNPYGVYLHDTNAKRLFQREVRAFSHGCIRMEKAIELAHYLVTGDLGKRSRYVERFLKEEARHWIEPQKPMPVYVRYYTSEFRDGKLTFYRDFYKKDSALSHTSRGADSAGF